ncbi:MAG: hypothetical protein DCF25_16475 [Leptolyngbya foveolarum]|uniref:Uncharacterized protein n=1 Tax=Leptolyngbya foveolarum TaxID=47253 RepID=A0A2W4TZJ8_9CYAN|nr:MAG: hypothetical protein DCF25_16475 [Leptolyngbya foveolarum]
MDKAALSKWVEEEHAKGTSYRQLALSLGVSPTAVTDWRDRKFNSISEESLQAIALRRRESLTTTAEWLRVEAPVGFDLPQKFNEIEQRLLEMERKVEYSYQRLVEQDAVSTSTVLEKALLANGVNVRDRPTQVKLRTQVEKIAGDSPALFERLLLAICGITPMETADLPAAADLLKVLTDQPWTPSEVVRVLNKGLVS